MQELTYKPGDLVNYTALDGTSKPAIVCSIDNDYFDNVTVGIYGIIDKTYTIVTASRASSAIQYIATPALEWQQLINVWRTTQLLKRLQEIQQ